MAAVIVMASWEYDEPDVVALKFEMKLSVLDCSPFVSSA